MKKVYPFIQFALGALIVLAGGYTLLTVLVAPLSPPPETSHSEHAYYSDTFEATSSGTVATEEIAAILPRPDTDNTSSTNTSLPTPPPVPPPASTLAEASIPSVTHVHNRQNISTPGLLVVGEKTISADVVGQSEGITPEEIVHVSNVERAKSGLPPLVWNTRLGAMAEAKAFDMITRKYFAHEAPDGTDIGDLAEKYGYAFLNIGENLALGDFATSGAIVSGWMNSPGHRANIMSPTFLEIGVAALRGTWEGGEVWFAVQEFGRPLSVCPMPSAALKAKITIWKDHIERLGGTLERIKHELEQPGISADAYHTTAKDYNTILTLYNKLVREVQEDIATYNAMVDAFNSCAAE